MKVAIIGYGKMGKAIANLAEAAGHELILKITGKNADQLRTAHLQKADVAIEFSRPENSYENIRLCLEAGIPIVCGTTAWLGRLQEAKDICQARRGAFMYASNFSIGVHIFFAVNRFLARMMDGQLQYDVAMEEVHHTQKLDAPSGTAITLAEDILEQISRKKSWVNDIASEPDQLSIISNRIDKVAGTHSVNYEAEVDAIRIEHKAHSRDGFARGALRAAEWIIGKEGFFEMKDMLGF